eukprot:TRINITY_DN4607_c0_g3_i2.p1 TRINITY_DN4607_c0_g3~~TRINITY_DN4607_c0_g3_i2.p1  ORF type:complete len:287 (+),score=70.26 TRINITY_DN4607_c0_g3_i2:79-939(+)
MSDPFDPSPVSFSVEKMHRTLVEALLNTTEGHQSSSASSNSRSSIPAESGGLYNDEYALALRKLLASEPYYEARLVEHKEALRRCMAYCARVDEKLIKGYIVTSINEWGIEQERVLLISDKCLYRLKYVYETQSVERCARMPFGEIFRIEYGTFYPAKYSLAGHLIKEKLAMQSGLRVVAKVKDGNSSINDVVREAIDGSPLEFYRTYRPYVPDPLQEKVVVEEIASLLMILSKLENPSDSARFTLSQSLFRVLHDNIELEIPGGLIALSLNAMSVGSWNKVDSVH